MSTFRGLGEVIAENGLFCSLYADRASHYWHTPEAGRRLQDNPTQVSTCAAQIDDKVNGPWRIGIAGLGRRPGAARSACSGPCRSACPRSCASSGIATMAEANRQGSRSSSGRRTTPASPARPRTIRPSWLLPARSRTCVRPGRPRSSRTPCALNRSCRPGRSPCHHYVKDAAGPGARNPDGHLAGFQGPAGVWRASAPTAKPSTTTGSRPSGVRWPKVRWQFSWTKPSTTCPRLHDFPTGAPPTTTTSKRLNSYGT